MLNHRYDIKKAVDNLCVILDNYLSLYTLSLCLPGCMCTYDTGF